MLKSGVTSAGVANGLRYLLSHPVDAAERALPLLCFLHGYDEAVPLALENGVTRHGPLRKSSARLALTEFIFVAPQLPHAGDVWHRYAADVAAVVDRVASELPVQSQRRYLTGFSFGGNGVFALGAVQPDLWAALWAVDPTRVPRDPVVLPIWLSIGQAARVNASAFIRTLHLADANRLTDRDLRDQKGVFVDEGYNHADSATHAYADDRIYLWLLSHHK
jgi:predicted peptidase